MWLFAVILGWPLLEIALFVVIGGEIGLWLTLAWVVLSAVLGVLVLRLTAARQALALRGGLRNLRDPGRMAAAGMLSLLGAALLILPGFLSDALGVLLLLPPLQAILTQKILPGSMMFRRDDPTEDDVIDGEFTEAPPKGNSSGWTRLD